MMKKMKAFISVLLCLLIFAGASTPIVSGFDSIETSSQGTDLPIIPIIPDDPDEPVDPDNPGTQTDPIRTNLILGAYDSKSFTMDYYSTATFNVSIPYNATAMWSKDGKYFASGASVTIKEIKQSFTLSVMVYAANGSVYTDSETVTVRHGIGDIIIYIIRRIFHALPVYVDNQKV